MTTEELVAAGVLPSEENVPPSTSNPTAEVVRESSSREDGEIIWDQF
jgi:hypothetical protein